MNNIKSNIIQTVQQVLDDYYSSTPKKLKDLFTISSNGVEEIVGKSILAYDEFIFGNKKLVNKHNREVIVGVICLACKTYSNSLFRISNAKDFKDHSTEILESTLWEIFIAISLCKKDEVEEDEIVQDVVKKFLTNNSNTLNDVIGFTVMFRKAYT